MTHTNARGAAAYRASQTVRQQEAGVFRYVVGSLQNALKPGASRIDRARAASDAFRLWQAVDVLVQDPHNALSLQLRALIAGIAAAAMREATTPDPDLQFLAGITENVGIGLAGDSTAAPTAPDKPPTAMRASA